MSAGGFSIFAKTGKITPAFVEDFEVFCEKVYSHWSLAEDLEEFTSSCLVKAMKSLEIYDPTAGAVSTYLFSVIQNEARRINSKFERYDYSDIELISNPSYASLYSSYSGHQDLLNLYSVLLEFAKLAWDKGIYVNQEVLLSNYLDRSLTPAVKAFIWFRGF